MHQVPQPIWNEIAKSQPLSPMWRELFSATEDELPALMEALIYQPAKDADNRVQRALALVAPLWMESEAISQFIVETGQASLRASLPEVNSVDEAVMLASQEFPLKPYQQKQLRQLLIALQKTQTSAKPSATQSA